MSRHRKLQERPKRRIHKYFAMALEQQQGASLLEVLPVAPTTVSRYRGHLERFLRWADDEGRELREDVAVDSAMIEFLNHSVFHGLQAWEGERLLAALLFFWSESGRCGCWKIPRSWRCVEGWRRVTPLTAPAHDVARGCSSAGFPVDGKLNYDQRIGVPAHFRGLTPHATRPWRASANSGLSCCTQRNSSAPVGNGTIWCRIE